MAEAGMRSREGKRGATELISPDVCMLSTDFPHVEGTWPRTRKSLARCFKGIPLEDARTILTDTPAKLYGFDVDALQPIANRICPTPSELVGTS